MVYTQVTVTKGTETESNKYTYSVNSVTGAAETQDDILKNANYGR